MSGREAQVHDELHRLDPRLADLFVQALYYLQILENPASVHMLSHAGREISNAVIRILTGEGETIAQEEAVHQVASPQAGKQEEESQRRRIAVVLDLPEQHPSVMTWVKAHNALQGTTHFGSKPPSPERVEETVRAFRALTDVLFGRIGLYFEARQEIEELLQVERPTEEQVRRLQTLAARPQLRHAFFRGLRHVGWLEPLAEAGLFREAPDVRTDPDTGELTAPPWPEAAYLESSASEAPEKVVEILQAIPDGNSNPLVWRGLADAALRLPPEHATHLVPKLGRALAQSTHPMVSRGVFAVAEMLAAAGDGNALEVLRTLLRVVPTEDTGPLATSRTGRSADMPNLRHTVRPEAFLSLVELIARVRPRATVAALASILNEMLVLEFGDLPDAESVWPDHSRYWHGRVEDEADRSAKSLVAAAVLRAAGVAADSEEAGAAYVFERLSRYRWEIFRRLRLAFLADRPVFDQQALDHAISDADLFNEPHLSPEYRDLLVAHLADASRDVRESIIDRIRRGPDEEQVARFVGEEDQDTERAKYFKENWKRHRLRVFGDEPPPELHELATELGVVGESLSKTQRDLDRYGFSIEVGVGGGPTSPLSSEELQDMSPEDLIEYLRSWEPEAGRDAPTPAGLASVIAERVQEDVDWTATFLRNSADAEIDATYLRGALDGLTAALKANRPIPWAEALKFVEWLVARPPEPPATESPAQYFDYRDPGLLWARKIAADFLSDAARDDIVPGEHREQLWSAVEALVHSEATWIGSDDVPTSMDGVLHVELYGLGGKAAEAVLNVALNDYRAWQRTGAESGEWPNRSRLRPLLNLILEQTGEAAIAARSALGRYLPQIMLLDDEWLEMQRDPLFAGAIEQPFQNPVFASYIVRSRLYGQAFQALRPLYDAAVAATAEHENPWTSGDESFRPGRHLLSQLVLAYRQRWLTLPADSALLDAAFTSATPEDSAHVWWQIFRYWSDEEVPPADVERVVELLDWRISKLEEEGRDEEQRREEAEGLAWLAMADRVPAAVMLPLLLRTVRLSRGKVPIAGALWEHLARMAAVDGHQAVEIAVLIIVAELRGDYPHFNFEEVAPVLRIGLASADGETRDMAERVIHRLGDRGFEQFGQLLRESGQEQEE